jgi:hypothetical protein
MNALSLVLSLLFLALSWLAPGPSPPFWASPP